MKFTALIFAALLLASCSKEEKAIPDPTAGMNAMQKKIYETVWESTALLPVNSNHMYIGKEAEFQNTQTATGEIITFTVTGVEPFMGTGEYADGVRFIGANNHIDIMYLPFYESCVAWCFVGDEKIMSRQVWFQ